MTAEGKQNSELIHTVDPPTGFCNRNRARQVLTRGLRASLYTEWLEVLHRLLKLMHSLDCPFLTRNLLGAKLNEGSSRDSRTPGTVEGGVVR